MTLTASNTLTATDLRECLEDVMYRVAREGKRLVVTRHGRPFMAVVPMGDLEALESDKTGQAA